MAEEGTQTEIPLKPALLGGCPEVEVKVQGRSIPCVLDTGSQVTLFSNSLFKHYFQNEQICGINDISWLTLKAANGLKLPYVGYAILDFEVGGVLVPAKGVIIVEDDCLQSNRAILGMNVINHCWEALFQGSHPGFTAFKSAIPPSHGAAWDKAFSVCRRIQAIGEMEDFQGTARLSRITPVQLQPETEMLVWAQVPHATGVPETCVLVEDLGGDVQEWRVGRAVLHMKGGKVPLRVCNPHPYPITLPTCKPLAKITGISQQDISPQRQLVLRQTGVHTIEVDVQMVNADPGVSQSVMSLQGEGLTQEQQSSLDELLQRWSPVFAAHDEDYGKTSAVLHQIHTGNAPPVRERYRPVPPTLYPELRALIQGMLDGGVITESASPWAAPVVLVRKKDGNLRFCVDYRKLNSVTHKDAYPLPRIEESLTGLRKAAWYSTLDLASGYWQVEVHPNDKEKTAFTTPMGLYQFERMPFGLCNGPATFQRLMQRCLGGQVNEFLMIYLDDVIVYSADYDSHLLHLEQVFERLHQHGLKLNPKKSFFFRRSVHYLGHVVSQHGVATDPEKVSAVQQWATPKTVKEVRAFLGFVGYYRRFISGFSHIAGPLHKLLQGTTGTKATRIQWTRDCQDAFEQLKQALLQAPILAFADFTLPFILYTDASLHGLGAVLAQVQEGKERVIAYASRSLHPAERNDQNYSSFKLELLALKWAITEKFKDYLWGAHCKAVTDNRPLVHLQSAKLGATEQRWVAQLANFDFEISYRPGVTNQNADALSRLPEVGQVSAVAESSVAGPELQGFAEGEIDWLTSQEKEPDLSLIRRWKELGSHCSDLDQQALTPEGRQLLREWERLALVNGVLVRRTQDCRTGYMVEAVVVPNSERRRVWGMLHHTLGHARGQRQLEVIRLRAFWIGMARDLRHWTAECHQCVLGRAGPEVKAPLQPVVSRYPFEILALDYLSLGRVTDSHPCILVVTDLFSRYAVAVPTRDQTAQTTAKALWIHVIQQFGCPERILTDQGGAFESQLFQQLCQVYGCRKSRTTPYHPQGNGACERFNQTLLTLLNTLDQEGQERWADRLPALLQAYNNTPHSSTGLAPFYVVFGRHARLPVDMALGLSCPQEQCTIDSWVQKHHKTLVAAYSQVRTQSQQRQDWDRRRYNKRARALPLLPGERVLCRNFRRRARGKLGPYWLPEPFVVVKQVRPGQAVYVIQPEGKEANTKTIHRNHLRPCPGGWTTWVDETVKEQPVATSTLPTAQRTGNVGLWPVAIYDQRHPGPPSICQNDVDGADASPPRLDGEHPHPINVDVGGEGVLQLRRSQRSNFGLPPVRYEG